MDSLLNPSLVYLGIVLGAVGVLLAMPRKGISPQAIGGLIVAVALAVVGAGLVLGAVRGGGVQASAIYFYVFAGIAVLSALRVITHPRPVYAALYFILTVLSTASIAIIVGAEFLGFALIIIYAGAILITYLFVIMLATQAPSEEELEALSPYDAVAREPVVATGLGFTLVAVLTGATVGGIAEPTFQQRNVQPSEALLAQMPRMVLNAYDRIGLFDAVQEPTLAQLSGGDAPGRGLVDPEAQTVSFAIAAFPAWTELLERREIAELLVSPIEPASQWYERRGIEPEAALVDPGASLVTLRLPEGVGVDNAAGVGWALIADHPITLELAGIILLMAMLGAVVLARKQIEIGEEEKEQAAGVSIAGPPSGHDGRDPATGSSIQRGRHVMVPGDSEGAPS